VHQAEGWVVASSVPNFQITTSKYKRGNVFTCPTLTGKMYQTDGDGTVNLAEKPVHLLQQVIEMFSQYKQGYVSAFKFTPEQGGGGLLVYQIPRGAV
jgi:hypothetical protein